MRNVIVGWVLGLVCGLGLAGGAWLAWELYDDLRAPALLEERCSLDTGGTGWCVQRRDGSDGDELWFVGVTDGVRNPRVTVTSCPFCDEGLDVTFEAERITVHGADGRAVYERAFYEIH